MKTASSTAHRSLTTDGLNYGAGTVFVQSGATPSDGQFLKINGTDAQENLTAEFATITIGDVDGLQDAIDTAEAAGTAALADSVILAPASSARNIIVPAADATNLVLKASAGQTENLLEFKEESGTILGTIASSDTGSAIAYLEGSPSTALVNLQYTDVAGRNGSALRAAQLHTTGSGYAIVGTSVSSQGTISSSNTGGTPSSTLASVRASATNLVGVHGSSTNQYGGRFGSTNEASLYVQSNSSANTKATLVVKQNGAGSANLQEWQDSAGSPLSYIDYLGQFNGTVVGGGQETYDAIVAASGGDYTTVGAAYTGGARRIFVRNGTYAESSIQVGAGEEFVLVGESKRGVILEWASLGVSAEGIQGTGTTTNSGTMDQFIVRDLTMLFSGTLGSGVTGLLVTKSYGTHISNVDVKLTGSATNFIGINVDSDYLTDGNSATAFVTNVHVDFVGATITTLATGVKGTGSGIVFNNISVSNDDRTEITRGVDISGFYSVASNITGYKLDKVLYIASGVSVTNVSGRGNTYDVWINGNNNNVANVYSAGTATNQVYINGNENNYTGGNSQAPIRVVGDYNMIANSRVDAASGTAITVSAGADYNSFVNIDTGSAATPISDSGTGTKILNVRGQANVMRDSLGIGTVPSYLLHVKGDGAIEDVAGYFQMKLESTTNNRTGLLFADPRGTQFGWRLNSSDNLEMDAFLDGTYVGAAITIARDADVGVGVSAPLGPLQVKTGSAGTILFFDYTSMPTIEGVNLAGSALVPIQFRASKYNFVTDTDGVGINNTAPTSHLHIGGSFATPVVTKTADYPATSADFTILGDATGGDVTITLPAASGCSGRIYNVKKIDSSVNNVIVDGNASETIDGATTQTIGTQWENLQLQCDGAAWYVL